MKIGFVAHTAYPEFIGGREHHTHNLANALSDINEVVIFAGSRKKIIEKFKLDGYTLIRIPTISFKVSRNPLQIYRVIPRLYSVLKKEKPDLIHAFEYGSYSTDIACLFSKRFDIPFLLTIYGYQLSNPFLKIAKKIYDISIGRLLFKEAKKIFFVSEQQRKDFSKIIGPYKDDKALIQENCINIRDYETLPSGAELLHRYNLNNEIKLITIARLLPRKRVVNLVYALNRVIEEYGFKDIKLLIIGPDCGELPNIQKAVKKLNLERYTLIIGAVPYQKIKYFLDIGDIFALPSVYEGLPLALLEAMASGKAVIFTNLLCTRRLITDGLDGLLVEPDNIGSLARAILRLSKDKILRRALGMNARNKAKEFDCRAEAERIKAVYEETLK